MVIGLEEPYFEKEYSDSKNKYTEEDIIKTIEFLVDYIFMVFAGKLFSTDNRHSLGHKLCPSPIRLFLYSYETEFIVLALCRQEKVCISVQLHT